MNKPDARAFEEKLLTIDLVDGLRREQERLDAALADAGQMQELRTQIQAYYAQAGITVPDTLIDQAIAERQAQRFAFKAPRLSPVGHFFASLYVHRGVVATAAIVLAVAGFSGWYAERRYAAYQQEQALAAYRGDLERQLSDIQASERALNALPVTLPIIESAAIPALPNWVAELQASYQQAHLALDDAGTCAGLELPADLSLSWSGEDTLAQCHARLPGVQSATSRAQQLVNEHRDLATAVTNYDLLRQRLGATPALLEWKAIADTDNAAQAAAAVGSNRAQFTAAVATASAAVNNLSAALGTHSAASSCLSSSIGEAARADDRGTLESLLAEGAAFKQSTRLDGIGAWATRASSTCEFFNSALTLRVVNERREQTGVWRYYEGNRNARSYYIVVDALTTGGGAGKALFESAEDQRSYQQSRFAVRVSERVFDSIRRDKEDDGILRDAIVGEKPADTLQWQLDEGFEPSFIAEW